MFNESTYPSSKSIPNKFHRSIPGNLGRTLVIVSIWVRNDRHRNEEADAIEQQIKRIMCRGWLAGWLSLLLLLLLLLLFVLSLRIDRYQKMYPAKVKQNKEHYYNKTRYDKKSLQQKISWIRVWCICALDIIFHSFICTLWREEGGGRGRLVSMNSFFVNLFFSPTHTHTQKRKM